MNEMSNFRPASILTTFLKIYEKGAKSSLKADMNKFLSPSLSVYRKNYSTEHVLVRLVEEWRDRLDSNYVVVSVFMGLSKAFDFIPHDLLIAKLDAYGFKRNLVLYIYSYLEKRKLSVRINSATSIFNHILPIVLQRSVSGPTLFNLFFDIVFLHFNCVNL